MKHLLFVAIGAIMVVHSVAENRKSWLLKEQNAKNRICLLECTYDKALLKQSEEITPASANWEVSLVKSLVDGFIL